MRLEFQTWAWLIAIVPAVAGVVWLARTTRTPMARWRHIASLTARLVLVAAVVMALAGATFVRRRDDLGVFFVFDLSKSVPVDDQQFAIDWVTKALKSLDPSRDRAGYIVFGGTAAVEQALDRALDPSRITAVVNRDSTDVAQAIRLAVASFPPDIQKRIVLITDGEENLGNGLEAAREARAAGIDLRVLRLERSRGADAAVDKITIPGESQVDEAFDVLVHTRLTGAAEGTTRKGTLRLYRNRELAGSYEVELGAGDDVFRIPQKITKEEGAGGYEYEAVLEIAGDSIAENNRAFGHTRIEGEARVLLVEGRSEESQHLEAALRAGGVANLRRTAPDLFPVTMTELLNYDAVILDNVPANRFSSGDSGQMQLMKDFVESHGGGLVMVGGDQSFGPGGYHRSPVEDALPVSMDVRHRKTRVSMALVIAIDQSGSMSMTVPGGQTKIQLANEAAASTVALLHPLDKLGVVYVDTAPMWAVKMQPVTDDAKRKIIDDIRRNRGGGGGIYVKTALSAAYPELDKVEAAIKHIILFSDASDSEQREGCIEMAARECARGRTLTVIGMGRETDQHGAFLRELAVAGRGRITFVEDVRELPRIFTDETILASKSALVEKEFKTAPTGPSVLTEGIDWNSAPPLHGHLVTTMKARAEMALRATEEDALLAKWQYGLGRAAAFTSDASMRWAKDWIGWDGYRRLWPQVVRWGSRRKAPSDYRTALYFASGRGRLTLDAFDEKGEPRNFLDLAARVSGPSGKATHLKLIQRGNGRYEADFPADASGGYFVTIADKDGNVVGQSGGAVSYPAEYRAPETRPMLISDIEHSAGGRLVTQPQGLFEHTAIPAEAPQEIWPILLQLAIALLLADIVTRRIAIPELALAIAERVRLRRARPARAAEPALERLLAVKQAAVPSRTVERIVEAAPPPTGFLPPPAPSAAASLAPSPPPVESKDAYMERLLEAKKRAKKG